MVPEFITKEAFEKFFSEYYAAVLRYCATLIADHDDAEDIVQQVFIQIWEKRIKIVVTTSARAYLYKSVYNASLDHIKHQKVRKKYQAEKRVVGTMAIEQTPPKINELNDRIEKAIAELPDQCRRIFTMSRTNQLKYREIAAALNISEKTVENQMGKALRQLRLSLKEFLNIITVLINLFLW